MTQPAGVVEALRDILTANHWYVAKSYNSAFVDSTEWGPVLERALAAAPAHSEPDAEAVREETEAWAAVERGEADRAYADAPEPWAPDAEAVEALAAFFRSGDGASHYEVVSHRGGRHTLRAKDAAQEMADALAARGYRLVRASEAQPLDVERRIDLTDIAAAMLRGEQACERGHRAGEINAHVHFDQLQRWARRLAALAREETGE